MFRPPPAIVRLTPKAELVSEYRARFFERFRDPAAAADHSFGSEGEARRHGCGGGGDGEAGRLRSAANEGAAVAAEADMESIVVQESALQRRVDAERVRLATKVPKTFATRLTARASILRVRLAQSFSRQQS